MKRAFALSLLMLFLVVSPVFAQNFSEYKNEEHHYSFMYPTIWTKAEYIVSERSSVTVGYQSSIPEAPTFFVFGVGVSPFIKDSDDPYSDKAISRYIQERSSPDAAIKATVTTFHGSKAILLNLMPPVLPGIMPLIEEETYVVIRDSLRYDIGFCATPEEFKKNRNTINDIIKSFKFSD